METIDNIKHKDESEDKPKARYPMNDLGSVYVHYNPKTGKNEPTPNKLSK